MVYKHQFMVSKTKMFLNTQYLMGMKICEILIIDTRMVTKIDNTNPTMVSRINWFDGLVTHIVTYTICDMVEFLVISRLSWLTTNTEVFCITFCGSSLGSRRIALWALCSMEIAETWYSRVYYQVDWLCFMHAIDVIDTPCTSLQSPSFWYTCWGQSVCSFDCEFGHCTDIDD